MAKDVTTTDLNIIRTQPGRFALGKMTHVYDSGVYTVVQYVSTRTKRTEFLVYVDGEETGLTGTSIAEALQLAVGVNRKNG